MQKPASWAVKPISRSQWNDGYGADSGPSRGDPCRRAYRPIEASKTVVCDVRNTSTPAVRFAPTVAIAVRLEGRGRVRSQARCQRYLPDLKCRLQTVRAASLATYSIAFEP